MSGEYLGQPVASSGARIDLHMLRWCREDWFAAALASLRDQPCNLYLFDGDPRGPGHVRARALACGSAPLVGWVDDDDWLALDAVGVAADYLDAHPQVSAVYSDVMRVGEDGGPIGLPSREPWTPHRQLMRPGEQLHFMVFRRRLIQPNLALCAEHPWMEWAALQAVSAKAGPLARIPQTLYYWRRKGVGGCAEKITVLERERLNALAAPILMALVKGGVRQGAE